MVEFIPLSFDILGHKQSIDGMSMCFIVKVNQGSRSWRGDL